ncbi:hypothetical protein [Adlercreutzia murintestinalis]|uniref:hypothetical protein n=1 Tax=Adlercreutzia murintestinalis TaxID=2941325 RepID=UPI00203E50B9|nr:hypothetical protein [Adlercreutzia murintestinalis]
MRKDDYNWLDDPFDEEKQARDLERAQASRNVGCIAGVLAIILIVVALGVFGCVAAGSFLL